MTSEDVIRMAKEAGFLMLDDQAGTWLYAGHFAQPQPEMPALKRFASLVAAEEREACADRCEVICHKYMKRGNNALAEVADECKDAIRERSNA